MVWIVNYFPSRYEHGMITDKYWPGILLVLLLPLASVRDRDQCPFRLVVASSCSVGVTHPTCFSRASMSIVMRPVELFSSNTGGDTSASLSSFNVINSSSLSGLEFVGWFFLFLCSVEPLIVQSWVRIF